MKEPKGKPPSHLLLCSDFIRAGAAEADRDECAVNAAEAAAAAARAASSIVIAFSPRPSNRTGRKIERVITTVAAKEKKSEFCFSSPPPSSSLRESAHVFSCKRSEEQDASQKTAAPRRTRNPSRVSFKRFRTIFVSMGFPMLLLLTPRPRTP